MKTFVKKDALYYVKDYYSKSETVKGYTNNKLFPSEEIIIQKYFKATTSILDIGCGAGRTSIDLSKKGYKVTAFDLIPEMIEVAKQQAKIHETEIDFTTMNAVDMSFPDESFDNVLFSYNGLEYIPQKTNREKVVKKVFKILKPNGYFIFTVSSGLAIGHRTIIWLLMLFLYPFIKIITNNKTWEFGDKIWKGQYIHYLSPFYLKSLTRKIGFQFLYFNSSANIEKRKKTNFFTNFTNDKMLFFVLKK